MFTTTHIFETVRSINEQSVNQLFFYFPHIQPFFAMKKLHHFLISLIVIGLQSCCTPDPNIGSVATPLRSQQTSMWCWAASGEMSMDFLGTDVSQCDQANKRFGRTDCCNSPVPNACVNGGWPEFTKYGFTSNITSNAALSFEEIKSQIYCRKSPIAYSWHWNGGGGHMMVINGYAVIDGNQYVSVQDPGPPNVGSARITSYNTYVSGSGYTHWNDYYNIKKN